MSTTGTRMVGLCSAYRSPSTSCPFARGAGGGAVEFGHPEEPERHDDGHARDGVHPERPARADGHEERTGQRGADHPSQLEHARVDADRVAQVLVADDLGDEDLACGVVDDGDHADEERDHPDVPRLHDPGQGEHGEHERQHRERALREHHERALREAVDDDPAEQPKNSIGANWHATVMPTCATEPVSCRTSQSCAMRCIHPAVIATRFVAWVKMRKFGTDRR